MGTRHLIGVVLNGEYKVAQYGQWDGYFEGQGQNIVNFLLKKDNIKTLIKGLKKVRFLEPDGRDKEFIESYDSRCPEWSNDPDNRTEVEKIWQEKYLSRDLGSRVLTNIATSPKEEEQILLRNSISFAEDSVFCEYAYIIDLDKNVLEFYVGYNKTPLDKGERFYKEESREGYYPIRLFKKINFCDLTPETGSLLEKEFYPDDDLD